MKYRSEIDGLRAIAVLAVILYHAELNILGHHFFEGGYLGVDIFFVISGYLITHIILSEVYETGSFNFKNFYERRARRILPMLFVVMLISIPFAWKILLPSAFIEFAESIFTSIFFSSNFYFYFTTTEYGAESSLLKPLLHTWSLGVEEQFYLIFPILALAVFKYAKKYLLQILFLLLLGSLFYAEFMSQRNSELNFFLPISRVWELAVGSLLAYKAINYKKENINNFWHQLLPLLGLFLIFYSFFLFQEKTTHPGLITVIPVIGTALIVGYSSSSEFVGRYLSTKPMVGMGLISYSAYLWHFPIFAFYRNLDIPETLKIKFALILSTFILSIFTYITIEKPFRNKNKLPLNKIISIFSMIFLFLMAFIISAKINKGFEARFPEIQGLENFETDNKKLQELSWSITKEKTFFDEEAINKILIIGNSHGKDFFNAMYQNKELIKNTDFKFVNIEISCFDTSNIKLDSKQKFFDSKYYKDSNTIIISSRFPKNFQNQKCGGPKSTRSGNIKKGFVNFISKANKDNKNIIFLSNTAEFKKIKKKWVLDFIYNKHKNNDIKKNYEIFLNIKKETDKLLFKNYDSRIENINNSIIELTSKYKINYFDKVKIICDNKKKECSGFTDEGYKTFYDYGHWTLEGAEYFGKKFIEDKDFIKLLDLN